MSLRKSYECQIWLGANTVGRTYLELLILIGLPEKTKKEKNKNKLWAHSMQGLEWFDGTTFGLLLTHIYPAIPSFP